MRLVKQLDTEGCGLACTAMAARTTYSKVRGAVFGRNKVTPLQTGKLREIMRQHGVGLGARLIPFRTLAPEDLAFDALLKVNVQPDGRHWHWVIWDVQRQRILDPRKPAYKHLRPVSYVMLEKLNSSK